MHFFDTRMSACFDSRKSAFLDTHLRISWFDEQKFDTHA